jgi:undecaprenol kinase
MTSERKERAATSADHAEDKDVLITPEGEVLEQTIVGTMKIDPARHGGPSTNPNRIQSLKFAVAGLLYVLVREQSIKVASVVTILVVIVGLWLQIPVFYWAFLTLAIGSIWITECLNTAIEAAINMSADEPNAFAKIGKDVASAAALVASIVFVIIVILILVPRIIDRLSELAP